MKHAFYVGFLVYSLCSSVLLAMDDSDSEEETGGGSGTPSVYALLTGETSNPKHPEFVPASFNKQKYWKRNKDVLVFDIQLSQCDSHEECKNIDCYESLICNQKPTEIISLLMNDLKEHLINYVNIPESLEEREFATLAAVERLNPKMTKRMFPDDDARELCKSAKRRRVTQFEMDNTLLAKLKGDDYSVTTTLRYQVPNKKHTVQRLLSVTLRTDKTIQLPDNARKMPNTIEALMGNLAQELLGALLEKTLDTSCKAEIKNPTTNLYG